MLAMGSPEAHSQAATTPAAVATSATDARYAQLLKRAGTLVQAKSPDARVVLDEAIAVDGSRYEAHVLFAAHLRDTSENLAALTHLQLALGLAPDAAIGRIQRAMAETRIAALPPVARRQFDALMLVVDDIDKATGVDRLWPLREFMTRSAAFVEENGSIADVWLLRAQFSLELDYPSMAWVAAEQLRLLGVNAEQAPELDQILAQMERKGWLDKTPHLRRFIPGDEARVQGTAGVNDAESQFVLGSRGIMFGTMDLPKGVLWLQAAAEQGHPYAHEMLGMHLAEVSHGGITQNIPAARRHIQLAARWGIGQSQFMLGEAYSKGALGLDKDPKEAIFWLLRAVERGYYPALGAIARAYIAGDGVNQYESKGRSLLQQAVNAAMEANDASTAKDLAWALATDPDPRLRNGAEAVRAAEWASQNGGDQYSYFETLAASYAEAGHFEKASVAQLKALNLARATPVSEEELQLIQARFAAYRLSRPWRASGVQIAEVVAWQAIGKSDQKSDFEGYLRSYPAGLFVQEATARLAGINAAEKLASRDEFPVAYIPGFRFSWGHLVITEDGVEVETTEANVKFSKAEIVEWNPEGYGRAGASGPRFGFRTVDGRKFTFHLVSESNEAGIRNGWLSRGLDFAPVIDSLKRRWQLVCNGNAVCVVPQ